jgi:MinD superfamily P-loop ATPase
MALCPVGAVSLKPDVSGTLMLYDDGERVFSTARLKMGSGTSGKLVTEVKKAMKHASKDAEFAIVDGSPGIGCPVIASMNGVSLILLVAEPSASGLSDLERIVNTGSQMSLKMAVCINKADVNPGKSAEIEAFCEKRGLPFTGRIPYDPAAVRAVNSGLTIADVDCEAGRAVRDVFKRTMALLKND